jgi:hypothetical protein
MDFCKILEIKNVAQCKSRLSEQGIFLNDTPTVNGIQRMIFVDEPNLYRVIFQSRKLDEEDRPKLELGLQGITYSNIPAAWLKSHQKTF